MKLILLGLLLLGFVIQVIIFFLEKKPKALRILAIILILVGIIGSVTQFFVQDSKEKDIAIEGLLRHRTSYKSNEVIIYIGNCFVTINNANFEEGLTVYPFERLSFSQSFQVQFSEKGLLVSTTIRSPDNKIVAEIDKNNWTVNQGNYYKRNYDKSAIEVIDDYGTPVLQLELFDHNKLRICGVFISEDEYVIVSSNKDVFSKTKVKESNTIELLEKHEIVIEPWFVYKWGSRGKRTEYGNSLLRKYYEELKVRTTISNQYHMLNDSQLADTALEIVQELIQLLREQWQNVYKEGKESSQKLYKRNLRRNAIIVRNEILSRIGHEYQSTLKLFNYEEPVNIFQLAKVPFDLKNLTKILLGGDNQQKPDLLEQTKPLFFKNPQEADKAYRIYAASQDNINQLLKATNYPKEKYDELKVKYPMGFVFFSIDGQRNTFVSIPESSILRKDYYLNWNMLKITSVTNETIGILIRDYNFKNMVMGGLLSILIKRAYHKPTHHCTMSRLMIFTELLVDDGNKIIFVLGFTDKVTALVDLQDHDIVNQYGLKHY